jgi:hypothetical protein
MYFKATITTEESTTDKGKLVVLVEADSYLEAETRALEEFEQSYFGGGKLVSLVKTTITSIFDKENSPFASDSNFLAKLKYTGADDTSWTESILFNAEKLEDVLPKIKEYSENDTTFMELKSIVLSNIEDVFFRDK